MKGEEGLMCTVGAKERNNTSATGVSSVILAPSTETTWSLDSELLRVRGEMLL